MLSLSPLSVSRGYLAYCSCSRSLPLFLSLSPSQITEPVINHLLITVARACMEKCTFLHQFLSFLRDACIINHRTKKYFIYFRREGKAVNTLDYMLQKEKIQQYSPSSFYGLPDKFLLQLNQITNCPEGEAIEKWVYILGVYPSGAEMKYQAEQKRNKTNRKTERKLSQRRLHSCSWEKRFTTDENENENWKLLTCNRAKHMYV